MGASQLPMTTIALAMGLNVRVGMEDNVFYRRGEPLENNAQLVERAVRIARELDRRAGDAGSRRASCWRCAGASGSSRLARTRSRWRSCAVRPGFSAAATTLTTLGCGWVVACRE